MPLPVLLCLWSLLSLGRAAFLEIRDTNKDSGDRSGACILEAIDGYLNASCPYRSAEAEALSSRVAGLETENAMLKLALHNVTERLRDLEGNVTERLRLLEASQASLGAPLLQQTFEYSGQDVTFIVPSGVGIVYVKLWGAGGGGTGSVLKGGGGGFTVGALVVTPGEALVVRVGQGGDGVCTGTCEVNAAGAFGGGGGAAKGNGGGGGTYVLRSSSIVAAAGGGGGGGGGTGSNGGFGGGSSGGGGGDGVYSGTGGTQTQGGIFKSRVGGLDVPRGSSGLGSDGYDGGGGGGGY